MGREAISARNLTGAALMPSGPAGPPDNANSGHALAMFKARQEAKVGGWTETRPVSLGLLPSGPDPVGEWCVHRQPPAPYLDQTRGFRKPIGTDSLGPNGLTRALVE